MVQLAPICVYIEPHYCDPAGESRDGEAALGRRGLVLCDNISGCQRCKGYNRVGLVCSSSTTGQVLCGEWPD